MILHSKSKCKKTNFLRKPDRNNEWIMILKLRFYQISKENDHFYYYHLPILFPYWKKFSNLARPRKVTIDKFRSKVSLAKQNKNTERNVWENCFVSLPQNIYSIRHKILDYVISFVKDLCYFETDYALMWILRSVSYHDMYQLGCYFTWRTKRNSNSSVI